MRRFLIQIISGILGIWLATKFVTGVRFTGSIFLIPGTKEEISQFFGTLVFIGIFLGFLNFFIKPILKIITLPLRIITFNLFTLVISMGLIWLVDVLFPELVIKGILPLFWIAIILWLLNLILAKLFIKKSRSR